MVAAIRLYARTQCWSEAGYDHVRGPTHRGCCDRPVAFDKQIRARWPARDMGGWTCGATMSGGEPLSVRRGRGGRGRASSRLAAVRRSHNVHPVRSRPSAGRPRPHRRGARPHGPVPVDTGFIVYNEANYPNFTALLAHLGVRRLNADMSLSVSLDDGAFEYSSFGLGGIFAQKRNLLSPAFLRLLLDIERFFRTAPEDLADAGGARRRRSDAYLQAEGYGGRLPRRSPAAAGRRHLVDAAGPDRRLSGRLADPLLPEPRHDEHRRPRPVAHGRPAGRGPMSPS